MSGTSSEISPLEPPIITSYQEQFSCDINNNPIYHPRTEPNNPYNHHPRDQPYNPNNPHYPTYNTYDREPASARNSNINPNNPHYNNNPDYTPGRKDLMVPRRQPWIEGDLRKDRDAPLPWSSDPALHNSPACGGDNLNYVGMRNNRDRSLAVFLHRPGFKRQHN